MGQLIRLDDIDSYADVRTIPPEDVTDAVIDTVRQLHEVDELEPFLRRILFDAGETPHGPAEIVDIFTHKMTVRGQPRLAGLVLKGRSFPTVRPRHVSHQIYRLEKIVGLGLAGLVATGIVLDPAKEQFVSTAVRLGCDYFIADAVDIGRLLTAYGYICPRDGSQIRTGRCQCGYSPAKRLLNVLQEDALTALADSHALKQRRGLVILPPGGGKTRVAAEDAKRLDARSILYVAHTHEILDVAKSEMEAKFGADSVVVCDSAADLTAPATVRIASIQLVARHLATISECDYLVIDEFHHAAAPTYRRLLASQRPGYVLGLTATPFRGDRQDIAQLCENNVLVSHELRSGIDMGVLTPYHYYGCFDDIDYTHIRHNGVRYDIRDLERHLVIPERDDAVIGKWLEHGEGRPTLAFCVTQLHAYRFAKALTDRGHPAEVYLSHNSADERRDRLQGLRTGRLKVLCAVDVLNEGADLPFVECLLFLRPTESPRVFYQQLGRGLRQYSGKAYCIVVDFIGNFQNAYLVPEYHSLDPDPANHPAGVQDWTPRSLLNLPLGCSVRFEERVVDVFARQTLDPRFANRHNIAQILFYQYDKLWRRIGRRPRRDDVNRGCLLDASLYVLVFGSWTAFERLATERHRLTQ